ncbi:MAG: serine hydrolase domain-containing protein [Bacteroidota bacterium]
MNRIIKLTVALFFLLLGYQQVCAQVDTAAISKIVQMSVDQNMFEGTVLIAEKGEIVYHQAFGHKDAKQEQPIGIDTHFGIASITKMITAMVVLQLVEEGKFKLTDNLAELLPEYDIPKAKKITLHHLLLHISGLPNEPDALYQQVLAPKEVATQTLASSTNRLGKFNYANIDYILLGLIIEKVDGKPWHESVKERILVKTDMQQTGFLAKGDYPENFAFTFSIDGEQKRQSDPLFHIENFYAAGCMYATAADLLKLDQAMYTEELISEASRELMFTSYPEYNYTGYSVWTYSYPFAASKPRIMERRGGILGSNSVMVRMLDTNQTIIILSNNDQFNPDSFGDTSSLREALIIELAK